MVDARKEFRDDMGRLFVRDLAGVRREVELYPSEESLWQTVPGMPNVGGTLVLHLAGNIQHFIGAILGNTGYVRNRDAEFARRGVPRAELLKELDAATDAVIKTLSTLPPSTLETVYPLEVSSVRVRTDIWLAHLVTHLAFHMGQIDYHRRCVAADSTTASLVPIPAIVAPFPPVTS